MSTSKLKFKDHNKHRKHQSLDDNEYPTFSKRRRYDGSQPDKPTYYTAPAIFSPESGFEPNTARLKSDLDWQQHMFDLMAEDEGIENHFNQFSEFEFRDTRSHIDMMSEEEYRRYIVNGIFNKTHEDELKREKERKRQRKEKERKREEAQRRVREEEERNEQKREAMRKVKSQQSNKNMIKKYMQRWEDLEHISCKYRIRFKDIPWPVDNIYAGGSLSEAVKGFLLQSVSSVTNQKQAIRKEQLRFHPDKFIPKFGEKLVESETERKEILDKINEVSSALNQIWNGLSGREG